MLISPYNAYSSLSLNAICEPISGDLQVFEKHFKNELKTKVSLLDTIMQYMVRRKGKQIRPMFVFFSAKMMGSVVSEKTYRGASLIELLHTATLIHDDVVDDSDERRGFFSLNALWKNKISVLVGDFLLSKGLLLSVNNEDFDLLKIVSRAVKEMSEGELLQMERSRRLNIDEGTYFEIIRQKTATLIASACAVGVASCSGATPELVQKVWGIGEEIGIAFQIRDDLLDLEKNTSIGKPQGIDIKEKKLTLPVIYALNNATESDRKGLIYSIKNEHRNPKKVAEIIDFVHTSGGIEYAYARMHDYANSAMGNLQRVFGDGVGRRGLEQLICFTIQRKK